MIRLVSLVLLLCVARPVFADEVRCAVAANFAGCLGQIAEVFEEATGHTVVISKGSTGSHYAQIRQGAPFHLYFAADSERPRLLEEEGFAVVDSRATYALGRLVLWTRRMPPGGQYDLTVALNDPELEHLAVADPRLAPYGRAARQVLDALGLDPGDRLVTGRNVAQAWHFVAAGAAEAGFVAASQVDPEGVSKGIMIPVPADLHDPIRQEAVLLKGAPQAAHDLLAFVLSGPGQDLVRSCGYHSEGAP